MKKIFLLVFCLLIICVGSLNNKSFINLCDRFPQSVLSVYCSEIPTNFNGSFVKNGDGFILQDTANEAKNLLKNLKNINGFSLCINGSNKEIFNILEGISVLKQEKINNNNIYYAYMPNLINYCIVDGKKINLQVAINQERTIIGCPLILGSF